LEPAKAKAESHRLPGGIDADGSGLWEAWQASQVDGLAVAELGGALDSA
jgi:hypothetical protein